MKYNQYGRINIGQADQIKELVALKFLPEKYETLDFSDLLGLLFGKLFPNKKHLVPSAKLSPLLQQTSHTIFLSSSNNMSQKSAKIISTTWRCSFWAIMLAMITI